MPVLFRCSGCGTIIYRFERVGQDCFGLPTPSELLTMFNGKCPSCGRKLKLPNIDDIVIAGRVREATTNYVDRYGINSGKYSLHPVTIHEGALKIASVNQ